MTWSPGENIHLIKALRVQTVDTNHMMAFVSQKSGTPPTTDPETNASKDVLYLAAVSTIVDLSWVGTPTHQIKFHTHHFS